ISGPVGLEDVPAAAAGRFHVELRAQHVLRRGDVAAQPRDRQVDPVRGDCRVVEEGVADLLVGELPCRICDALPVLVRAADPHDRAGVVFAEVCDARAARLGLDDLAVADVNERVLVLGESVAVQAFAEFDEPADVTADLRTSEVADSGLTARHLLPSSAGGSRHAVGSGTGRSRRGTRCSSTARPAWVPTPSPGTCSDAAGWAKPP